MINNDKQMSVFDHLDELRWRLIVSLLVIVISMAISYRYVPLVLKSFARPVGRLVFLSPFEAFWVELKIALFLGGYLAGPIVFYQIWRFVEVGLYRREKRNALFLSMLSFIFFTMGAGFCYTLVLPFGIKFLLNYQTEFLIPMISFAKYFTFVSTLLFSFGIIFQLPLIIAVVSRLGIISPDFLIKQWRLVVLGIFIIAAALTPGPDVFSQLLMAGPLLLLYLVSIIIAKIVYPNRDKPEPKKEF
ncbi:MAG: twin-arginine translocase subunit TatC [Candidatus Omnitrophota bacterium]